MLRERNYQKNRKLDALLPKGLLNGQGMGSLARFRYGLFSFGWCGCEIIAAYNLLQMAGKPEKLSRISREIYRYGHVLLGFFGTNVYVLSHFLKKHGVRARTVYRKRAFFRDPGAYGVVSFWTKPKRVLTSSVHTVAYRVHKGGAVTVYNRYNNRGCAYQYASIDEAFGKYPFIVANVCTGKKV
ncbi:MAG: hypothetical protein IKW76_12030 [Clostridia bacterium]|nr:hypothetical protein [Clostridia bacterium]